MHKIEVLDKILSKFINLLLYTFNLLFIVVYFLFYKKLLINEKNSYVFNFLK